MFSLAKKRIIGSSDTSIPLSRGNRDMRLLVLFYRGHDKGCHGVASRVDILLNQDSAWFRLAHPLVGGLFYSEDLDFEADKGS